MNKIRNFQIQDFPDKFFAREVLKLFQMQVYGNLRSWKVINKEKTRGRFLSIFIPSGNFIITPILIDLNILVFILMVIGGTGVPP